MLQSLNVEYIQCRMLLRKEFAGNMGEMKGYNRKSISRIKFKFSLSDYIVCIHVGVFIVYI